MEVLEERLVAVMGVTGSGKSNFLQKVLGENCANLPRVGSTLESCTQKTESFETVIRGCRVVFFDTPGFDDTYRGDADILADIAQSLSASFKSNVKLSGVVYLQRIKDERMTNALLRNLAMFKSLCGDDAFKNVVLATTFWDEIPDRSRGEARERQLVDRKDWWGFMAGKGSKVRRFENTRESAVGILGEIIEFPDVTLQIQREMVAQGREVHETTAGEELGRELAALRQKFERDLQAFREEEKQQHDEEVRELIRLREADKEALLRQVENEQEALRVDRREEQRLLEQRFNDQIFAMRRDQMAREQKIRELEDRLGSQRRDQDRQFQEALVECTRTMDRMRQEVTHARGGDREARERELRRLQGLQGEAAREKDKLQRELEVLNEQIRRHASESLRASGSGRQQLEERIEELNESKRQKLRKFGQFMRDVVPGAAAVVVGISSAFWV